MRSGLQNTEHWWNSHKKKVMQGFQLMTKHLVCGLVLSGNSTALDKKGGTPT